MAVQVEKNKDLFQEKVRLLKRIDEIDKIIGANVQRKMHDILNQRYKEQTNEDEKMDETTEQEAPKLSMQERYTKAQELIKTGKKNSEIAKELGCSVTYVYNVRLGKIKSKVAGN